MEENRSNGEKAERARENSEKRTKGERTEKRRESGKENQKIYRKKIREHHIETGREV